MFQERNRLVCGLIPASNLDNAQRPKQIFGKFELETILKQMKHSRKSAGNARNP